MSRRSRSYGYYDNYYYPRTTPRAVDGGIKIKKRGEIATHWWSRKLLSIIKSFGWENRMTRGVRYARAGQVLRINVDKGKVEAEVQGSARKPYKISIVFPIIGDSVWNKVLDSLKNRPEMISSLLGGIVPTQIEDIFLENGTSLFPEKSKELDMSCSCPDYANPCKHIAAVFYVLAENFDNDPFLILNMRGRDRKDILSAISLPAPNVNDPHIAGNSPDHEDKNLYNFWNAKELNLDVKKIARSGMNPLEKYSLPDVIDDPSILEILLKYYREISRRIAELDNSGD